MKPLITLDLSGPDGNIFFIVGHATQTLKLVGQEREAGQLTRRVLREAHSYHDALALVREYVDLTDSSGKSPEPTRETQLE